MRASIEIRRIRLRRKSLKSHLAIIHTVEVGALAEMLVGENLMFVRLLIIVDSRMVTIERHPRHHVVAIYNTVIPAVEFSRRILGKPDVANPGLPKSVYGGYFAGHLRLSTAMQHRSIQSRKGSAQAVARDEHLGIRVVQEYFAHCFGYFVVREVLLLDDVFGKARGRFRLLNLLLALVMRGRRRSGRSWYMRSFLIVCLQILLHIFLSRTPYRNIACPSVQPKMRQESNYLNNYLHM